RSVVAARGPHRWPELVSCGPRRSAVAGGAGPQPGGRRPVAGDRGPHARDLGRAGPGADDRKSGRARPARPQPDDPARARRHAQGRGRATGADRAGDPRVHGQELSMATPTPILSAVYRGKSDELATLLAAQPVLTLFEAAALGDAARVREIARAEPASL